MGRNYERKRDQAAKRDKAISTAGRDIGLQHPDTYTGRCACQACGGPKILKPARRKKCSTSLYSFGTIYRPNIFVSQLSLDHKKVIAKMEQAVLRGGLFAVAMPRASGKTTWAETAVLWSMLYGLRRFIVTIGATQRAATDLLDAIKSELETNDLLLEDFPEVCYPIRCLEGISHRCKGQVYCGERTHIEWRSDKLVVPSIKDSAASGTIVISRGITGSIRGLKHSRPDGHTVRPDLVIPDDPQTRKSADSPLQCEKRLSLLNGEILGLAGPMTKISGIVPCTVIRQGDLSHRLLDRQISPEWQGETTKMLYKFPDRTDLWDKYAEIRSEGFQRGEGTEAATEFYRKNRKAMDKGAEVGWKERFNDDEISAVQKAMNLWLHDPVVFAAEYQNDPIDPLAAAGDELLSADEIAQKISGYKKGEIPSEVEKITGFVDVQAKVLYWMICGWSMDRQGWILDYGSFPDQKIRYYTLSTLTRTLAGLYKGAHLTGRIRRGLADLVNTLGTREWVRDDGTELRLDRMLIDFGWEPETGTVKKAVRELEFKRAFPSKGVGIKAGDRPMKEWSRQKGDRVGEDWKITKSRGEVVRHVLFDANAFKTSIQAGLVTSAGDPGCIQLWKDSAHAHRMVAEHLSAEYPVETEGRGRRIKEWKLRPGRDNHLLDCLVGCTVAAAIEGCVLQGVAPVKKPRTRQRVSYQEL